MEEDKSLDNIMNDDFGKIILKIRKEKNLTQKEFADLINVSDRTISKWENGISVPDLICIKNICKALGISPSSLVLDKKSKKEHINAFHHSIKRFFNAKCILNLIFITLFLFLFLFYLNNRNTVTIYKLKLANDDFYVGNSYYIRTKYKNVLVINDITINQDINLNNVRLELYTYVNGDKKVIYERNSLENIYIDDFEDYSPYLTKDIINSISNSLCIAITISQDQEDTTYEGTFSIIEKYHNNKVIKENEQDNHQDNKNEIASVFKTEDVNTKLIDMGYEYDSIKDCYFRNQKDLVIKIDINNSTISFGNRKDTYFIVYYYDKNYISYYDDNSELFIYYTNKRVYKCSIGDCKNYYKEIDEILGIYQEIKEIL